MMMNKLAAEQAKTGKGIERMLENFYKDSKTRKNSRYFSRRITKLEQEWEKFRAQDTELQKSRAENPEHPYFAEEFFAQVEEAYEELKGELEEGIRELESAVSANAALKESPQNTAKRIRGQQAMMASMDRVMEVIKNELAERPERSQLYYQQNILQLKEYWTTISTTHYDLLSDQDGSVTGYNPTSFHNLEDSYQALLLKLLELSDTQPTTRSAANEHLPSTLKLPKISIPSFSGDYMKWKQFHDLFSQLIDGQPIPDIQKMFYLKSNLAGEASRLVRHLQASAENYKTAWGLLKNRYDNERLIVSAYLNNMLSIPAINADSANALKRLHDTVKETLLGIQNLGIDVKNWDPIILHLLLQKVDKETHRLFEQSLSNPRQVQPVSTFLGFIESRFQLLETLGEKKEKGRLTLKDKPRQSTLLLSKEKPSCELCKKQHYSIRQCVTFLKLPVIKRLETAKRLHHCLNCLQRGHALKDCKSRGCLKCNQRHNTLLHHEEQPEGNQHIQQRPLPDRNIVAHTASNTTLATNYVFLGTALIEVKDKSNQLNTCRAILDSGSQLNFITERLFHKLGLKGKQSPFEIQGIGTSRLRTKGHINICIKSRINNFTTIVEAVILPEITTFQPSQSFDTTSWPIPGNIQLADPEFYQARRVDVLLGAEVYHNLISIGQIRLSPNLPTLQNSVFGWIVFGKVNGTFNAVTQFSGISTRSLDEHLQKFWALDDCQSSKQPMTSKEKECEAHFKQTTYQLKEGRFVVRLPFAKQPEILGNSKDIAIRRFLHLERRLEKDKDLKGEYTEFMNELLNLNHMEPVPWDQIPKVNYFLPHHCVLKPESTTTKLRVVFDGSCKTTNNISLNDILLVGPSVQDELFTILLRFRLHKYVFTADITKMYRQILVAEEDRNFQLIVWRDSPTEPLKCYRLRTVTYGTACAPYLAIRTLQHLAEQRQEAYPLGAKIARNDFYVDDVITGSNSLQEALQMQQELRNLLQEAGLPLRKWCANHKKLLQSFPKEDLETTVNFDKDEENFTKSLGLIWYPHADRFSIRVKLPENKRITKRTILADIAHVYDPLGLINPVISLAKIFMQQLWQMKLDWDAAIPQELHTKWIAFREGLKTLPTITIPRHVLSKHGIKKTEIHAFSDASERAYGAVIYLRSMDQKGNITVHLLCAKSRVAPIKKTTLPRLELCAAHLMVNLVKKLKDTLFIQLDNIYFWTDSTITLSWIRSPCSSFKTFVSNRISYIQDHCHESQWRHVPTKQNPADLLSRGAFAKDLITSNLWFQGPTFLQKEEAEWPTNINIRVDTEDEKRKPKSALVSTSPKTDILEAINHRNSFKVLQHTIAYVKRFIYNLKSEKNERRSGKVLHPAELHDSLLFIIKKVQARAFHSEIKILKKGGTLSSGNPLKQMAPFLDKEELLRVGGRLDGSDLPYDAKHQIVLPYADETVKLLIKFIHEKHLHAGPQALLAITRQQFWPLNGKRLCQTIVHKCIRCSRTKPKLISQLMGDLPPERVHPSRPFLNVGIDFCGPVYIHYKIRGKTPVKTYIAVFVCFSTKAVHMELVSDLTKDAFLGALKRFIGRRGRPAKIFCDNATNFVGAKNELQEVRNLFANRIIQDEIMQQCSEEKIEWHFIPPRSPHFGGLWEAAVKAAKYHLRRAVSGASLTYEELHTVIVEAEAVLNSRPLTPLSTDPNDLQALSPGHFLIGEPLTTMTDPRAKEQNIKLLRRWELVRSIQQQFWKRWTKEYLQQLQTRTKWHEQTPIKKGILVIVKEDTMPPLKWPLGRIIDEHKGPDGVTRVVDIKTEKGIIRRAIHNIALLPIEEMSSEKKEGNTKEEEVNKGITEKEAMITENKTLPTASLDSRKQSNKEKPNATVLLTHSRHPKKGKRKIMPINANWLNSPAINHRSKTLLKYSQYQNTTPQEEQPATKKPKQYESKSLSTPRLSSLVFTILLVLITPAHGQSMHGQIEIIPFKQHPSVYFEDIAQMSMVTDNWNIVVYYNLKDYWKEIFRLQTQLRKLKEICNQTTQGNSKQYCQITSTQFQMQINTIQMNNEILIKRSKETKRMRRSPFDFVGSISNKLFGILDQEYADHISDTIVKIRNNEDHLLELIKNQTSIIDSTHNLIKQDRDFFNDQLSTVNSYLEDLHKTLNSTNKVVNEQQIVQTFNMLAIHLTLMITEYQRTQAILIDIITDSHNGKINPLVVTPNQLQEELKLIREHIPSSQRIPGGQTDHTALLQLYKFMTVQARTTPDAIIFKINLPLLSIDAFQIFKVVPIPIRVNSKLLLIKVDSEYLAVSLHRDYYYIMDEDELSRCLITNDLTYICNKKHNIFRKDAGPARCELLLLNQGSTFPKICQLKEITTSETWVQLHDPNTWIYILEEGTTLNIVCGQNFYQSSLKGEGILKFKSDCVIKQNSITIAAHHQYSSKIDNSYIPSIVISPNSLHDRFLEQNENNHHITLRNNSEDIDQLKEAIHNIKQNQHLPKNISNDIHQFTISYLALGVIIIVTMTYIVKRRYCSTSTKEPISSPEPTPRRINFQLRLRKNLETRPRFNGLEHVNSQPATTVTDLA